MFLFFRSLWLNTCFFKAGFNTLSKIRDDETNFVYL
jgi:hypothetical protein